MAILGGYHETFKRETIILGGYYETLEKKHLYWVVIAKLPGLIGWVSFEI